jgi:hypothetical protein
MPKKNLFCHVIMIPPDAGFIFFRYTDVINGTPSAPILDDSDNAAVQNCKGPCKLCRWTGMGLLKKVIIPCSITYNCIKPVHEWSR